MYFYNTLLKYLKLNLLSIEKNAADSSMKHDILTKLKILFFKIGLEFLKFINAFGMQSSDMSNEHENTLIYNNEKMEIPVTVYKFDSSVEFLYGRFVKIKLTNDHLIVGWKTLNYGDCLYIDDIFDIYIGWGIEPGKFKDEQKLRGFLGSFCKGESTIENCVLTICHGSDITHGLLTTTFLFDKQKLALQWRDYLRKRSNELNKQQKNYFYFWKRLFTKIECCVLVDYITPDVLTEYIIPSTKLKEERKQLESDISLHVPEFSKQKQISLETVLCPKFQLHVYMVTMKRNDIKEVFDKVFQKSIASDTQVHNYLLREHCDQRLNEILFPHHSMESVTKLINNYEDFNASGLTFKGYLNFLISPENTLIRKGYMKLKNEDMNEPLSHYFINSSHNTYLRGKQMKGRSSVAMYRYVLLLGCRSVELDCWDGPNNEPIITHGPQTIFFCTTILFKDVIKAIAETAFVNSSYPVILSFENHCSLKQQQVMAQHCRNILGDLLLSEALSEYPIKSGVKLPSPNLLKRKILIKNKKMDSNCSQNSEDKSYGDDDYHSNNIIIQQSKSFDETNENEEEISHVFIDDNIQLPDDDNSEDIKRIYFDRNENMINRECNRPSKLSCSTGSRLNSVDEISPIIIQNEQINKNDNINKNDPSCTHISSTSGVASDLSNLVNYVRAMGKLTSFVDASNKGISSELYSMNEVKAIELLKNEGEQFVEHNKRQITRVFPKGSRIDSSNFMPLMFFCSACQMVAINFQTPDLPFQINSSFFETNGNCGYVLKPQNMRKESMKFDPFETHQVENVVPNTLRVTLISGQMLGLLTTKRPLVVYVEAEMYGIPKDSSKKPFRSKGVNIQTFNTRFSNSINDENCQIVFDKIIMPSMAFLRLALLDENNRLLGQRIIPVLGLAPGYKHVMLRNAYNRFIGPVSLFAKFEVSDYVAEQHREIVMQLQNPIAALSKLRTWETALEDPIGTSGLNRNINSGRSLSNIKRNSLDENKRQMLEVLEKVGEQNQEHINRVMSISVDKPIQGESYSDTSDVISPNKLTSLDEIDSAIQEKKSSLDSYYDRLKKKQTSFSSSHEIYDGKKYSQLNEGSNTNFFGKILNEEKSFYIDTMDLKFPEIPSYFESKDVVKKRKQFDKKFPDFLSTVEKWSASGSNEKKCFKQNLKKIPTIIDIEKYEIIINEIIFKLIEKDIKKIHKRLEMGYDTELKTMQKNAEKDRLLEIQKFQGKASIKTKQREISDKYIKLGIENRRALLNSKERRFEEINQKFTEIKQIITSNNDEKFSAAKNFIQ
ncbi:Phospholipase C, phosphatidylinositol-specific, X domain and Phosphoinositide phospholipase C family and Phospholipase C, phosphatidylinositol-specific, Y domain and EF-hand domain pair and Phospholipase C,phosphoinositol-specific, EF-hand-like domain and PLC-like phosphodiesterase, TIM beta/alpha-barrel domain-containing protein [Strongyloides ratti]|uniref:1-phosphatidylinositol 4,5-bisphosphate phosphodiesterase n=1 Tax=Strongyloides ratti TaxID=34506 RepID=A0A090L0P0_STRRB|nr:Phospholipase C, phosphatidylinositol-specific, X domain and Phosphoinositide phospholipase C family and Phospholipase C, phosphatidylinositol-specific, Y domain and EF-hand domain pair and Phospholipase C,phosphoinositol-specific, EF-hand-like domain and PLC-like phosphodiesterase, TIM beta/alpha-barrel domain-containing protein [Strongyloides ratti]CEF61064.1 Phospholipase C, phosphatidylinositol-specific, X domain and Phosphoinositide phospholipase C family and Phospholipase C, phosphatidyli